MPERFADLPAETSICQPLIAPDQLLIQPGCTDGTDLPLHRERCAQLDDQIATALGVMLPALIGLFMIGLMYNLLSGNGWNFNWNLLWPLMFMVIGLGMIFGRSRTE